MFPMLAMNCPFKLDKFFSWAEKILCVFFVVYLFAAILFLFCNLSAVRSPKKEDFISKSSKSNCLYELIGTGPLSLNEGQLSKFVHQIRKEVVVLAKNTRPGKSDFLLGMKNGGEEKVIAAGNVIYLDLKDGECHFSEKVTPVWIKPTLSDVSIMIEVGGVEEGRFYAQTCERHSDIVEEPFTALKEALWTGNDKFIEAYGGEEYKSQAQAQKILFPCYACYAQVGDYLVWKEGEWKISAPEEAPLAYIKSITGSEMEIIAWDEQGFNALQHKIHKTASPRLTLRMEEAITSIRLRTSNQVSCIIGKKRMMLKPGDWLLKTAGGWHKLRRPSEIEDFLCHKVKGELFVFDSLEKEQGKMLIKGQIFDENRSQMQNIALPLNEEQKIKNKKRASFDIPK